VGVIAYSPLFRGLLFGTWTKDNTFAPDDGRAAHKDYSGARSGRQGALIASPDVPVTDEQANGVWEIVRSLEEDLKSM